MAKSKKKHQNVQKCNFGMELKITTRDVSRSLLCIRLVAVAFWLLVWRRSILKKETPLDLFWPRPGSAPDKSGQNALKHVRDLEYFIHTKFHQNPSSGSVAKTDYVFLYNHIHALVHPLFLHLNKLIKKIIKILTAFESFIQACFHLQTWILLKINVD